jgi:hypothetical protein
VVRVAQFCYLSIECGKALVREDGGYSRSQVSDLGDDSGFFELGEVV